MRQWMMCVAAMTGLAMPGARAETFNVTSAADDGAPGTLRWAIERNNAQPAKHRIAIQGPLVITLRSLLPPVTGPAVIAGAGKVGGTRGFRRQGQPAQGRGRHLDAHTGQGRSDHPANDFDATFGLTIPQSLLLLRADEVIQ